MTTDPERFCQLVEKYLEGKLTPDERRTLRETLAADADFRAQFVEWVEQEAALRAIYRPDAVGADRRHVEPSPSCKESPSPFAGVRRSRRWWAAGVAASLLIALGVSFWAFRWGPGDDPAIARLEQVQGEVYVVSEGTRTTARPGQPLLSGQGLQVVGEDSATVVVYPDATRLEFRADTTVAQLSDGRETGKKVVLAEGFLAAEVAEQPPGRPMVLATPHAEVVVLGTKFNLSNGTEATYLETEKGAVQLTRKSDGRSIEVPAGFDAVITGLPEPLAPRPLPPRLQTPRLTLEGYWTAALSPDGKTLATTRFLRGNVELWDVVAGQQRATLHGHTRRAYAAAFSPDGQTLATGGLDQTVKLWEVATGRLQATLGEQPGAVHDLAFSADGRTLIVLSTKEQTEDRIVTLWDLGTHQQRTAPRTYLATRWAFSGDGRTLATAGREDKTVTLRDLFTGRVRGTLLQGLPGVVLSLTFSPDGTTLAVDSTGGRPTLWDLSTGQPRGALRRLGGMVSALAYSRDGTTLATGQLDGTVRLWDVATAEPLATLEGRTGQVRAIAFAPDGKSLVTREVCVPTSGTGRDGVITLWDLPPEIRTDRKGD